MGSNYSIFETEIWGAVVLRQHQGTPPDVLFHYTDAAGLKGIVEGQTIWATHFEHTNDAEEVEYGIRIAIDFLQDLSQKRNVFTSRSEFDAVLAGTQHDKPIGSLLVVLAAATITRIQENRGYEFYFSCFSEEQNLLSQWRAYAANATGYSIGCYASSIVNDSNRAQLGDGDTLDICQVIYDPNQQREILLQIVNEAVKRFESTVPSLPEEQRHGALIAFNTGLMASLQLSALLFKHPGFSEEREWRLIYTQFTGEGDPRVNVRTRASQNGLIPYVSFPLVSTDEQFSIESVMTGPKNPSNVDSSFALKCLSGEFKVRKSGIPYR